MVLVAQETKNKVFDFLRFDSCLFAIFKKNSFDVYHMKHKYAQKWTVSE